MTIDANIIIAYLGGEKSVVDAIIELDSTRLCRVSL